MRKRVVITGLGAISPLGLNVEDSWQAALSGKSGVGLISHFDASDFKTKIAAEVKGFIPKDHFNHREARRLDRVSQMAVVAAKQAVEHSKLEINDENRSRIGAIIGSGIGGIGTLQEQISLYEKSGPGRISPFLIPMMLVDTPGGMIAIHLKIQGSNMAIVTACATGTNAIGEGTEAIRRGQVDVMLAGGSEAALVPISVAGMDSMTALNSTSNDDPQSASKPFDKERNGFVMGEGSAVLVLESLEHAEARGATILAEVSGYGSTNDAHHISAPAENGRGAADSMRMALENADLQPESIDYINAHGTSTHLNDKSETAAIKTVFGEAAYDTPVSSTKSMTGHLMGASGALEGMFCTMAVLDDVMPPTINYKNPDPECDLDYVPNKARKKKLNHVMSNSFGFGGHNATIIISKMNGAPA
jgi:3-oxoacyl-[acyl-carrier-protein] synthase II